MESQNKPLFCWNPPNKVSDQIQLNAALQWTITENWGMPNTTGPKLGSQAPQLYDAFDVISMKNPCHPNSEMCPAKSGVKSTCVGVSPREEFKLVNGKALSSCYLHSLESTTPNTGYRSYVIEDATPLPKIQDFGGWNGMLSEKFKLQSPGTLQKRFVMFDQTGSRRRIIFHPNQIPTLLPNFAKAIEERNGQSIDSNGITKFKLPVEGNSTDWDTSFPAYKEAMASAFAALEKMRADRLNSIALGNFGNEFIACSGEEEGTSRGSCNGLSQSNIGDSHSQLHEDTEDLEALLISDDEESSTGHSPSDVTVNCGHCSAEEDSNEITSGMPAKRRRVEKKGYGEEANLIIPTSIRVPAGKEGLNDKCHSPDVSLVDTASWEPAFQSRRCDEAKDIENNKKLFSGYVSDSMPQHSSSKGSANNRQKQLPKCFSGQSGSAKNAKKEKIKRTVRLLKSIIPGGDCMDATIVLDEAIEYLKLLQVKVQKLEGNSMIS